MTKITFTNSMGLIVTCLILIFSSISLAKECTGQQPENIFLTAKWSGEHNYEIGHGIRLGYIKADSLTKTIRYAVGSPNTNIADTTYIKDYVWFDQGEVDNCYSRHRPPGQRTYACSYSAVLTIDSTLYFGITNESAVYETEFVEESEISMLIELLALQRHKLLAKSEYNRALDITYRGLK